MAKLPSLRYVKFVRSKRTGATYAYFDTGQKIAGKIVWAKLPPPSTPGFYDSYAVMMGHRARKAHAPNTVASLADAFERSDDFRRLAVNTQKLYSITLKRIRNELGKFDLDRVQRRHVSEVVANRIPGNGTRNTFLAVLGILYAYGRRQDLTANEPTKDLKAYKTGEHEPWPPELLQAGLKAEHDRTRLVVNLLYYTGQRIGDAVRFRWDDIRHGALFLTQQKTGKPLRIPLHSSLRAELDSHPRRGETIICNHAGEAMTDQVIRREIKALGADLGINLVPHGLRKNAVNALLEAGCTIAEVAAITGQTYRIIEHYAKQVNQHHLGEMAIAKLENRVTTFKRTGKQARKAAV